MGVVSQPQQEPGPRIAVAVVTMGNRPAEVDALLTSVAKQDLAPSRIVVVGNGCPLPEFAERLGLPGEVTCIEVDENLGCPGGRNVALARLREFGDVAVVVDLDCSWTPTSSGVYGTSTRPTPGWASSGSVSPMSTARPSGGMCPGSGPPIRFVADR